MDQAISPEMKKRRKKKLIIKVVITVMASVGMFWFLVGVFQPKIRDSGRGSRGGFRVRHGEGCAFCRGDCDFAGILEGIGGVQEIG